ncbi:Holliday junction DNA helicase RuvA [Candidatus Velamenicoccus archaeovorus]|uniref:Holliday junction branch migration complex subunit RuvA n=1 Tax=Velamenicoccus archaeovorus TaxID=1930593 RepID=A0A410P429_VELA1|nr:Holliday junction branch migration protein RuvA [Candidatus Velamenicoccus archaeovorus]QAT16939.1 Holliday junction DNA helicase RuvA [Candidatus Velamenicoccus archaeovorus]
MIARIGGKLIEKRKNSVILENQGIAYEIFLPVITMTALDNHVDQDGCVRFITYHYHQLEPSRSTPVLIGFLNEIEKEFFEEFITVSGIGPKAALRAINTSIASIARAIDEADVAFLKSLPGIGPQRAKEIIAKLQGKIGKFGLIQEEGASKTAPLPKDIIDEAVDILMQLQYKKHEAKEMIQEAIKKQPLFKDAEELLNFVYKQRINSSPSAAVRRARPERYA